MRHYPLSTIHSQLQYVALSWLDFKGETIRRALPYAIADCPYGANLYTIF
ncbi:MAG: hypothetical protein LBE12_03155 [Planctomycetaceae bacterium]|nr:hypothetical protein [Planctomycetaceae bacterium]